MGQQLSLDTTQAMAAGTDGDNAAPSGHHDPSPRPNERLRLVGLAGVARARQALAEATKKVEERHLHQAA